MRGDFSVLHFDPHVHERGATPPAEGVLRNLSGVLHQQGRVTTDADLTEGELLDLNWSGQAGRDIIGAGVCAVPAAEPEGFRVESALVVDDAVRVRLRPGRAWADGILTRLAGGTPDAQAPVERLARYYGPPLSNPQPTPDQIGDTVRDAVILEVSEEALHGFQYPRRLIEPALGGPDTSERVFVNWRLRLLRLADGEDCDSILPRLRDDPSSKGRLTASLAPVVAIAGECPVVGGGGYTGFEHNLYRIEIADTPAAAPARIKWSQWNGGLAGRGRFDATTDPDRVIIDAGRTAIVNSGLTEFYLEALQYDELIGAWVVVYGTIATLNTDHDLELAAPASFGTLPSTTETVFFRLWNGLAEVSAFTNVANPVELRDGIRLVFDVPSAGNYAPGDYWTFTVRAGEIANPQVLIDQAPPAGIVYHRVPLAEIAWTGRRNTELSGAIEDCRKRVRPLSNQKICCTFLIGDGLSSFGDFNSLEEAAAHLPAGGGELCLLPGLHRANLRLEGRRNVTIHGCAGRSIVLPRTVSRAQPLLHVVDCIGIEVCNLDLLTYDGVAVRIDGSREGSCRDLRIHDNRMIARSNTIRATNAANLSIAGNRLHLLDTVDGRATISVLADDVLIERNALVLIPFVDETPDEPDVPDDNPTRNPADPCARPQILYAFPALVRQYAFSVWTFLVAMLVPNQPYRAIGGIHVRAGSERVRILENTITGGAGNGVTLGGDLDPADAPPVPPTEPVSLASVVDRAAAPAAAVNVTSSGQFLALVQDEKGRAVPDVDIYLEAETVATDRSDARGMASVKAATGPYTLDVSPQYRVVRVTEARDEEVLVNAVTVAPRGAVATRGFLHEVTIEVNDIAMMGLSGIGFALRTGAAVTGPTKEIPSHDPRGALLAYIDAALLGLALTPLLRATDLVRDLVIRNNRLHDNLRNPFTRVLLAEAQFIGRGGISLAIVESAVISGNHVYGNGPRAADPACGVFVGYGGNLEITDNVLAGNGEATEDFERGRNAGIRGGIYVRFAGSVTSHLSTSTGRNAALRVHDNRIDQSAGRALTAFAFGPVSVANNHLNSEFTGLFGFLDTFVGGALVFNLGGIHRVLARQFGNFLGHLDERTGIRGGKAFAAVAERALPGGETIFDDNYVRLGLVNRSITSQVLYALDDLGYSSNTSSVYRGDTLFGNAVLMADTVRATGSRFREDVMRTISLLTMAKRMNMTASNQADHCIVTLPPAGAQPLPTVDQPNQVLDALVCRRLFAEPSAVWQFLATVLSAGADQLGGTLSADAFTPADLASVSQQMTATSIAHVNATQVATTKAYQYEAARLAAKRGPTHPTTVALSAQAQAGAETSRVLLATAETVNAPVTTAPSRGSTLTGRLVNDRGQGLPDHSVGLVRANGTPVEPVGRTNASGYFTAAYDETRTAALEKEGDLFGRVMNLAGKEVLRDKTAIRFAPGEDLQITLVLPVRVVPKSVATDGTVIFSAPARPPSPTPTPAPSPTPTPPPTPTPSPTPTPTPSPTPTPTPEPTPTPGPSPVPVPSPVPSPRPAPTERTPLDKLRIDDATRARLVRGGIRDVEGILETDPDRLATIVGSLDMAKRLMEMARQLLGSTPPPIPTPTRSVRTDLNVLGVEAPLRKKLEDGGVRDVEAVLEVDAAKLAELVGDRAVAARLIDSARTRLGGSPSPRPSAAKRQPRRKKPTPKKPK